MPNDYELADDDDLALQAVATVTEAVEEYPLPNGYTLFRQPNSAGGHTYFSDEVGGGVHVWDTCLVDRSTLLAAICAEEAWQIEQARLSGRNARNPGGSK